MTTTNATTRRVSGQQLDILWEFLNTHRNIAVAYNRSLQSKEYSKRKWQEVAAKLNTQKDGTRKDWRGWSKYWVDYKAKLKKRVQVLRSSQNRTGDGPSTEPPLSENESKFLQILGEDYRQWLGGVQVKPFAQLAESIPGAAEVKVQGFNIKEVPANLSPLPDPPAPAEPAEELSPLRRRCKRERVKSTPGGSEVEVQGFNIQEAPASPLLDQSSSSEEMLSPRRRRRRRDMPLTTQSMRRFLVESSEQLAQATINSSQRLEGIENALLQIGATLAQLVQICSAILVSRN